MPKIILTDDDVRGIILMHNEGASLGMISALYSVSRTQIWRIVHKKQRTSVSLAADFSLRSQSGSAKTRVNIEDRALQRELLRFLKKI